MTTQEGTILTMDDFIRQFDQQVTCVWKMSLPANTFINITVIRIQLDEKEESWMVIFIMI